MQTNYDTIIIGSGVSVYGFVLGAPTKSLGKTLLVSSSEVLPAYSNCNFHPKLTLDDRNIAEPHVSGALCSHSFGGFSNSWGGVLSPVSL